MTDGAVSTPENPATSSAYSLSVEDLKKPPDEVIPYHRGDRLTRSNFIPFLVNSFAVGRGMASAQRTYVDWVRENEGFETIISLRNLQAIGINSVITEAEKNFIANAFSKVKSHGSNRERDYPVFAFFRSLGSLSANYHLEIKNLKGISFQELLEKIDAAYKEKQAKRDST